jgi:hypothetical protein
VQGLQVGRPGIQDPPHAAEPGQQVPRQVQGRDPRHAAAQQDRQQLGVGQVARPGLGEPLPGTFCRRPVLDQCGLDARVPGVAATGRRSPVIILGIGARPTKPGKCQVHGQSTAGARVLR